MNDNLKSNYFKKFITTIKFDASFMTYELTYEIIHTDLSLLQDTNAVATLDKGKYFVFWWKDTALGHLYVNPHQQITALDFNKRMQMAIYPTLDFYRTYTKDLNPQNTTLNFTDRFDEFREQIEPLIHPFLTESIPSSVPISVVVCTRNRPVFLQKCLEQLLSLTCVPKEIIVVDNAPDDDRILNIVSKFENVKYVREPASGLSIARNTGIKNTTNAIVAYTDDDVAVHSLWAYHVWETFKNPFVAAMTGLVIAGELKTEAQVIFEKFWSFNRGYVDKVYDKIYFKANLKKGPPVWEIGAGANMAFRKSIFDELGFFEDLLGAGASGCSEDSEMWFRILSKGHVIQYNPRAIVYHEHRRNMKELKKQIYSYMRGFASAVMLQQNQVKETGYIKHLFFYLPRHYIKSSFSYAKHSVLHRSKVPLKHKTLFTEIKGFISGIKYYYVNQKQFLK